MLPIWRRNLLFPTCCIKNTYKKLMGLKIKRCRRMHTNQAWLHVAWCMYNMVKLNFHGCPIVVNYITFVFSLVVVPIPKHFLPTICASNGTIVSFVYKPWRKVFEVWKYLKGIVSHLQDAPLRTFFVVCSLYFMLNIVGMWFPNVSWMWV